MDAWFAKENRSQHLQTEYLLYTLRSRNCYNRIKRLLRESYRKIKPALYEKLPHPYMGMILFNGKEIPSQKNTDKSVEILLEKWIKSISL